MITEVSVKTITEVDKSSGDFVISTFSDMNEDGSTVPVIIKSNVLPIPMTIDNIDGKEGELLLSYEDTPTVGQINEQGELIIEVENDNAEDYFKVDENLIYDND